MNGVASSVCFNQQHGGKAMMKDLFVSLLFIMFLGLGLFVPVDSFSANFSRITESEYQQYMRSSADFREADTFLNTIWKEAFSTCKTKEHKESLRNDQREWLKTGRHEDAYAFMQEGFSKSEAYAKAITSRANVLRVVAYNNSLTEEEIAAGMAKADDFYNAGGDMASSDESEEDEYAIPDNCGIVKSSFPIDDNLYQITLDNGKGVLRTFYYYHQKDSYATKCGDIVGLMCFDVLQEVPVTKKMRENGIQGDRMTLIHQCNAAG